MTIHTCIILYTSLPFSILERLGNQTIWNEMALGISNPAARPELIDETSPCRAKISMGRRKYMHNSKRESTEALNLAMASVVEPSELATLDFDKT